MEEKMRDAMIRDAMVFLVTSVVRGLQSASWTVFIPDEMLSSLDLHPIVPLCGYEIIYYHKDASTTDILLIPAMKGRKRYIVLKSGDCTEYYGFYASTAMNQEEFVKIQEKIFSLIKDR